jgi:HEAT repeat protein
MRIMNALLILAAAGSLGAQARPRRPIAPPAPETPVAPSAPMTPLAPLAPEPMIAPITPMTPLPLEAFRLLDDEMPLFIGLPQGQGRVLSRTEVERIAERAREQAREQSETLREQARMQADMAREQSRLSGQLYTTVSPSYSYNYSYAPTPSVNLLPTNPPSAWAQSDPADSLYRAAQQTMNNGDYRKAAQLFKEIPQKFKYSQYAVEAMYWAAHALYRVGTTPDLQEALQMLETLKATYPTSRIRGNNADVGALQVRIAGVLSARGRGGDDIVKRALQQNTTTCDNEEVQIRSAALNALMQTDAASAQEYAQKILGKKDECSRELRRSAVFLIGNKKDAAAAKTLIDVAKNDPSPDVRMSAIEYLGRMPGDEALSALEELLKTSDDQQVQRSAIRSLANNSSPRARAGIRALIERNDVNETQRLSALNSLSSELATTEDVNWLQGLYGKTDSPRVRSAIISAMARLGGSQNEKWFTTLANNENESIDVRLAAVRQAGQSMDVSALGRLYDQTGQRQLRYEIVRQLGSRREPETIDKLGDIAKNGTDPEVRSRAIQALSAKKDDRATKLLLQLIDRP